MYIQVYTDEDMRRGVEIPIEEDGTVSLEVLQIEFEQATGLKSRAKEAADSNIFRLMPPSKDGRIFEPEGGWQTRVYIPTYKAGKSIAQRDLFAVASVDQPGQFKSQLGQHSIHSELIEERCNGENDGNNADWADDNYQPTMGNATRVFAEQMQPPSYDDYSEPPRQCPPNMSLPSPVPLVSPMLARNNPRPLSFASPILPLSYQQSYMGNSGFNTSGRYPIGRNPYRLSRYNPTSRGGTEHNYSGSSFGKRYTKPKKEPVGTDDATGGPVFIYGLHTTTSENDVYNLFASFGNVEKVDLMIDASNGGCCKGFAFVTMAQKSDAINAIKKLDGHKYNQKILQVRFKADN